MRLLAEGGHHGNDAPVGAVVRAVGVELGTVVDGAESAALDILGRKPCARKLELINGEEIEQAALMNYDAPRFCVLKLGAKPLNQLRADFVAAPGSGGADPREEIVDAAALLNHNAHRLL